MNTIYSKISIVTSFDKNYFNYAAVMVKSLSDNYYSKEKLRVTCLVPNALLQDEEKFCNLINSNNLEIKFVNSKKFNEFESSGGAYGSRYITSNMYHRLFIGSSLLEFDRAIYIDPDTLILRNIEPLLTYPTNLPLAAVVEYTNMAQKDLNQEDIPYFNNGVFIADLNYWRKEEIEKKLIEWLVANDQKDCPEQSAMNEIFKYNWSPLPLNFNLIAFMLLDDPTLSVIFNNPIIVHFVGPTKPWDNIDIPPWTEKWKLIYKSIFN